MSNGSGMRYGWRSLVTALAVLGAVASVAGSSPRSVAAREAEGGEPIPLHVAVERGWVSVQVQGRGYASGDSIRIDVRRVCDHAITVRVEPGTVAVPTNEDVQSMALARVKFVWDGRVWASAATMVLPDKENRKFIVEGYCRDRGKPAPTRSSEFVVKGPDEANTRVLVRAGGERATVAVTQAAVWIQREQLTTDAARRHFDGPLNPADVEVAIRLASPELPQGANARGTPAAVGGNVVNGRTDIDVNVNAFRGMVGKMRRQDGANRPGPQRPAGKLKNVIGKAVQRVDQVRVAVPAPNADETAADPTAADETDVGEALGLDFFQLRIHGGGGGR